MLRDMDLKLLEVFRYVYERRSITEAAEQLHISQSTVSFHIKNLERHIGQRLFYRKGRSLVPTALADRIYEYARELAQFKLRLLEEIGELSGKGGGLIRIGASSIPGNYVLPELVGRFVEGSGRNPRIEIEVGDSASVYEGVVSGRLDFGVVGYLSDEGDLESVKLFEDRIWPVGNPEFEGGTYTLEDLKELPLVIRERGSGTRRTVEEVLRKHGVSLRDMKVIATLGSNTAILGFLKRVRAFSFLSSYVLEGKDPPVKLKVSDLEPIRRSFYLIRDPSRPLTDTAKDLVDFLLSELRAPC